MILCVFVSTQIVEFQSDPGQLLSGYCPFSFQIVNMTAFLGKFGLYAVPVGLITFALCLRQSQSGKSIRSY